MPGRLFKQTTDSKKQRTLNNAKRLEIGKTRIPNSDILRILLEVSMECKLNSLEQTELLAYLNAVNES
jgi:hypothetical protein